MTRIKRFAERVRRRIERAARGDGRAPFFSVETVLMILSTVYGGLVCLRARLYETGVLPSKTLPCRVVSIGNLIAGGTGKTPMTVMVARMIQDLGFRVVVLSRGYRGRMEKTGGVVSDGRTIFKGPDDAGDEPYLMARVLAGIPVVVGQRRYEAGMLAVKRFKPDVIVLDDAFQHLRLKRDLNLLLLDSRSPLGNGRLLPRGLLREPLSALRRAHAVVYTRSEQTLTAPLCQRWLAHRPIFFTTHDLVIRKADHQGRRFADDTSEISMLKGQKTVVFAGLADNAQFFEALEQAGCRIVSRFSFADHHRYGRDDMNRIAATAIEKGADAVVTTFKDYVKIKNDYKWPTALAVADVAIRLTEHEDAFRKTLADAVAGQPT
ncbi:MAG: tetraacyldisaccharide 4'-kinase [Desulfobacteraceae bacterium]|jgi:tetraacyldisaccharide 4'-kinase|nr:tetraacyldisaccharide 4'-kinase [Desulfobacteraceae bacterium]